VGRMKTVETQRTRREEVKREERESGGRMRL
jgi:hypothetical protein